MPTLGIDLGTTKTAIVLYDPETPEASGRRTHGPAARTAAATAHGAAAEGVELVDEVEHEVAAQRIVF